MIKILVKNFRWLDWLFVVAVLGITLFQVFCSMTLISYSRAIIASISLDIPSQIDIAAVWWNAGMMVLFAALSMVSQMAIALIAALISSHLATSLRNKINTKITYMSLSEIEKFSTASLITRVTNDVQRVQFAIVLSLRMLFTAPTTFIWAVLTIQAVASELTVLTLIAIGALIVALIVLMLLLMPKFRLTQTLIDRINLVTRENLVGVRVVRAFNAEGYQEEKFGKANDDLTKLQLFTGRLSALFNPVIMITMNGLSLGIYWLGATLINRGTTDYATLFAFSTLASMIVMSFMMLMFLFIMIPRAQVSAKRINEILDSMSRIKDPKEETAPKEKGTLVFKDVSFGYDNAESRAIEHISFEAKQGETIAFVGATGSGKSTLIRLLLRLYEVSDGEILVDGVNVKELKQSTLHHIVRAVPQKGVLFTGSVASNIAFGDPSLSQAEIQKAAEIACADGFINEMDGGYEAHIAQGGTNVSGGQRQRLCIARAVALQPEIITFDDSFSALDFKTDQQVRANLKSALASSTKIIVAARVGTIKDADKIVVLSEGKMVGYGRHEELLRSCPTYREIALSQLSKEELGL